MEGGPRRGVSAPAVATGAIVLAIPLPLTLPLDISTVVGGGRRRERGHQWTR
jgi:hypothetical protein